MKKFLKLIIDNEPMEIEMDVEGMLIRFEGMFNQFAHQCVKKTSGYLGNTDEFEDFKQMAKIKAIEKFESYDITKGANFSTLLFTALRDYIVDIIRKNESEMRKVKHKTLFIDAPINETGESASETIADKNENIYFEDEATELEEYLVKNLSKEEIMLYTIDLKKKVNKASSRQKFCLQHTIDVFTTRVGGYIPNKKEDLAILLSISRPTLNKRIKEVVVRVKELAMQFCIINSVIREI